MLYIETVILRVVLKARITRLLKKSLLAALIIKAVLIRVIRAKN